MARSFAGTSHSNLAYVCDCRPDLVKQNQALYPRAEATTDLVVLAADDPAGGPVARVHLGRRVPDGFHGNWMPQSA